MLVDSCVDMYNAALPALAKILIPINDYTFAMGTDVAYPDHNPMCLLWSELHQ